MKDLPFYMNNFFQLRLYKVKQHICHFVQCLHIAFPFPELYILRNGLR